MSTVISPSGKTLHRETIGQREFVQEIPRQVTLLDAASLSRLNSARKIFRSNVFYVWIFLNFD